MWNLHVVEHRHPSHDTIEHTHTKILVSSVKFSVSKDMKGNE